MMYTRQNKSRDFYDYRCKELLLEVLNLGNNLSLYRVSSHNRERNNIQKAFGVPVNGIIKNIYTESRPT